MWCFCEVFSPFDQGITTIRHRTKSGVRAWNDDGTSPLDMLRHNEMWRHVLGGIEGSHLEERAFVAAARNTATHHVLD